MSECIICSSETALITAAEEEEYNVLCDNVTLDKTAGQLQARYPLKNDPGVLIDNGKEARHQLKNKTHSQYVKQFRDMVSRNVVSEISQVEIYAYTGPFNYITHHKVYKLSSYYRLTHLSIAPGLG